MSITGSIVIFVLIWWIIFFSLLPLDVDRNKIKNIEGVDTGAPENPKLLKKLLFTTLIASVIFVGIYLLVKYDYLNLRNFIS